MYRTRIADWPEDDRPREKLTKLGPEALSDAELLAIILRVGVKNLSAIDLARKILQQCGGFRGIDRIDIEDVTEVPGIGVAKAAQIKAAIAIGKRLAQQESGFQPAVNSSRDAYNLVHLKYRDLKKEVFSVMHLTSRNRVIEEKALFHGSVTESMVAPREVVKSIIQSGAAQVIFLHNHPSGETSPSEADVRVTQILKNAGNSIDVHVVDHLIIGSDDYYSFADHNRL